MIDFGAELTLRSTDARTLMKEIVAEAVQTEIRSALEDELIDVERAAAMLDMTEGALRKAVERGQVPCQRVGNRLRFRRMDLLRGSQVPTPAASTGDRRDPSSRVARLQPGPSANTTRDRNGRRIAS